MAVLLDHLRAALADRFLVEEELGRGGMATVFRARDVKHDRAVALKVLHPDLASAVGPERFFREIQVVSRLNHPHILPLLDSGQADGLYYFVMPLMSGETLRARLKRERELPVADALRIATQIAGALSHAHRHGVVHRDIKPENILLQDGEVLVADFGIAYALTEGGDRLTGTGLSLGTPQYMSPEQATGDRKIDARADVYSLGCVLYEMLAGQPPHTGPTGQAIIVKMMTDRPVQIRTMRDTVPEAVDRAVLRALSRAPADRFASADEFATELAAPVQIQTGWSRRRLVITSAVTLAVLAAGVTGRWAIQRKDSAPAVQPNQLRQVTFTGDANDVALSPDGETIAYSSDSLTTLVLSDLSSGGLVTVIREPTGINTSRWSPSGARLMYSTGYHVSVGRRLPESVFVIPRFGGEKIDVSLPPGITISNPHAFDFGMDDSTFVIGFTTAATRNKWIYLGAQPGSVRLHSDDSITAIGRVIRLGGVMDGQGTLERVRISPNGDVIAFSGVANARGIIGTIPVAGGAVSVVVDSVLSGWIGLEWSRLSDGIYYTWMGGATGGVRRQRVDAHTGKAAGPSESVIENLAAPWGLGISRDGNRIALSSGFDRMHSVLVRLGVNGVPPVLTPVSCGTASCFAASVSPDGRSLAFFRNATSSYVTPNEFVVRSVTGGDERVIARSVLAYSAATWSADGSRIAYMRVDTSRTTLVVAEVASGAQRDVWRGFGGSKPAWSADGRQIVFGSAGGLMVLKDSIATAVGGDATKWAWSPVFSPDGRRVAVRDTGAAGRGVYLVDLSTGAATALRGADGARPVSWSARGDIYILQGNPATQEVRTLASVPATGGIPRVVGVFPKHNPSFPECQFTQIIMTADMRSAVCSGAHLNSDVWVMDNFDPGRR